MDATAATTVVKTVNFLTSSGAHKVSKSTTLTRSNYCIKPKKLTLYAFHTKQRSLLTLTQCLRKPDTSDNVTDKNSTVEPNPDIKIQPLGTPTSNKIISSSSSSPSSSSVYRGLVFELGQLNSWDDAEIGSPVVKRFISDDQERWYMWYYGRSNNGNSKSDLIGLAVSGNGIHWERGSGPVKSSTDVGLVMKCSEDWWAFDTGSIKPSEIVIMSSEKVRVSSPVYWLYYTGFSSEILQVVNPFPGSNLENPEKSESGKVFKSLPGLAISQDGRHWARIEGEHHTGALLDVGSEK